VSPGKEILQFLVKCTSLNHCMVLQYVEIWFQTYYLPQLFWSWLMLYTSGAFGRHLFRRETQEMTISLFN
jgi:hypothetical protein